MKGRIVNRALINKQPLLRKVVALPDIGLVHWSRLNEWYIPTRFILEYPFAECGPASRDFREALKWLLEET